MTPDETKIVDRIVLLRKLTKLRQHDRDHAGSTWGQPWRDKSKLLDIAAKRLSSSLSAYVAHGIHDKDDSRRELIQYCKDKSGQINSLLKEAIPEGEEHAKTRQAVLDATKDFGVVTSVFSLNECLSTLEGNKTKVRDKLNEALPRSADAPGFTEETANRIASGYAHLQQYVHNEVMSSNTIFLNPDVGNVDPVPWDAQARAGRIAEVEADFTALDNVRAATPHGANRPLEPQEEPQAAAERPLKRKRQEIDEAPWQDQRDYRLRSQEAAAGVKRTPGLRRLDDRPRVRGSEQIKEIREFDPRSRTRRGR